MVYNRNTRIRGYLIFKDNDGICIPAQGYNNHQQILYSLKVQAIYEIILKDVSSRKFLLQKFNMVLQ